MVLFATNEGRTMRILISLFLFLYFGFTQIVAQEEIPARPVSVTLQTFNNNEGQFIALNFENHPKWHTYWKNPGDAGLPIQTVFTVEDKEIKFTDEEWPVPQRYIEIGNLQAYGYEGAYSFFYKITKKELNQMAGKEVTVWSKWLVCKHICIPGEQKIKFKIVSGEIVPTTQAIAPALNTSVLMMRYNAIPRAAIIPNYLEIKLSQGANDKTLVLSYTIKNTVDQSFVKNTNLLFPFPQTPFDFRHEKLSVAENSLLGLMEISWDGEYQSPPVDLPKDGKFKRPYTLRFILNDPIQKKPIIIEKKFIRFDLKIVKLSSSPKESNDSYKTLPKEILLTESNVDAKMALASPRNSFLYYLLFAFLGGLILNIMPCVLPVVSIKLFSLIKYKSQSRAMIIRHNVFYTLGILVTFVVLALVIVSLKSIGSQVGWGFQLQSPTFIAIMIIFLFIFSLNLFGVFEFRTPGGKKLGNVRLKDSFTGDFFSGVLATILATPCSAPFLGTALTFAFSSTPFEITAIFLMIGLGLASPFILTAFVPQLVSFLPKPGNWMNTVKKILGITLILTTLWLFDIYNVLVDGQSHLLKLATALVFIYAGFLLFKKEKWIGLASFLISFGLFVNLSSSEIVHSNNELTALIRDKQAKGLNWEPWSEARMFEHKTNALPVFINFTAKWCFTCKVNEGLILDTDKFKLFVNENNLKLLLADWTKRDEVIGSFLRKNGMVGVPAYFVQKKDGTLVNLGEIITIERIRAHLN